MKKLLSITLIMVFSILQVSCSVDTQEVKTFKAKDSRHQIILTEDWVDIEATMFDYVKDTSSTPERGRFYPFCHTVGINFALVMDSKTDTIYKVTWTGGLTYSVEKVTLNYAAEQCRLHLDPYFYSSKELKNDLTVKQIEEVTKITVDYVTKGVYKDGIKCSTPKYSKKGGLVLEYSGYTLAVEWFTDSLGKLQIKLITEIETTEIAWYCDLYSKM